MYFSVRVSAYGQSGIFGKCDSIDTFAVPVVNADQPARLYFGDNYVSIRGSGEQQVTVGRNADAGNLR